MGFQFVKIGDCPVCGGIIDQHDEIVTRKDGTTVHKKCNVDPCNDGKCERFNLGAEPCTDCPYCDDDGNFVGKKGE